MQYVKGMRSRKLQNSKLKKKKREKYVNSIVSLRIRNIIISVCTISMISTPHYKISLHIFILHITELALKNSCRNYRTELKTQKKPFRELRNFSSIARTLVGCSWLWIAFLQEQNRRKVYSLNQTLKTLEKNVSLVLVRIQNGNSSPVLWHFNNSYLQFWFNFFVKVSSSVTTNDYDDDEVPFHPFFYLSLCVCMPYNIDRGIEGGKNKKE